MSLLRPTFLLFFFSFACSGFAQVTQSLVDSICRAGNFPGLSVAIVTDDQTTSFVSGYSDVEKKEPLRLSHRFLQGSVGKTYVSAIALQLIQEGKLGLSEKVSKWLGHYEWFHRLPNAKDITLRMLLNHSSGIMRYEFKEQFTTNLTANPGKYWKPEELLQYVLDEKAPFAAGEGWDYSDTNFILVGMIIEAITGKTYYRNLEERILAPLHLSETFPSNSPVLPGLAQGYAGADNPFGGRDKVLDSAGRFIINPQFEWTGGGIYSTTTDLARWAHLLYSGKIIDTTQLLQGAVPAKLGRDSRYGLGVIIRSTNLGQAYGHSGFFPGFLTEVYYFPQSKTIVAVQINSSDFKKIKMGAWQVVMKIVSEKFENL